MTRLTLIVAATKSNGIGQNGRLPWRLPREMAYFARVTSQAPDGQRNAVVMGRNTWESIPTKFRPLAKRLNIVISRNKEYELFPSQASQSSDGICLYQDLTSALNGTQRSSGEESGIHRTFVIGGASLYDESLQLPQPSSSAFFVDRILLTRILSPAFDECDVFMQDFQAVGLESRGANIWTQASHQELQAWVGFEIPEGVQEEKGVQYEFQMWTRGTSDVL